MLPYSQYAHVFHFKRCLYRELDGVVKIIDRSDSLLKITQFLMLLVFSLWWSGVFGQDSFSYKDIAERYRASRLSTALVDDAKMQGECLVGLKKLNFRKREDFDPVAEWTNYRSLSLLDQYPPCAVLIMMEVARTELIKESPGGEKPGRENRADVDIRGE